MDQVKQFLRQLNKHRFWVICAVVTLAGGVVYFLGVSQLDAEKKAS